MQLRDYQTQGIKDIAAAYQDGFKNVMFQLPTGGGKTVILSKITEIFNSMDKHVMIMMHRKELIRQTVDKLSKFGVRSEIIQSEFPYKPYAPIQTASVQTLARRKLPPQVDLIIVDEAHHATANTYRKTIEAYPNAKVLGVTATPIRTGGEGFEDLFETMVLGPSVKWMIEQGYLVKPKIFAQPNKIDLSKVKRTGGDYNEKALMEEMSKKIHYGDYVKTWQKYANGKKTITFAINVEHSKEIVKAYREAGITAEHLDGNTPTAERHRILNRFRYGFIQVLSNVGIVTEGFDVPDVECVQLARPTTSLALYLQMVGRGLRPLEGKKFAIILDHVNAVFTHGFPQQDRDWKLEGIKKLRRGERPQGLLKKVVAKDKATGKLFEDPLSMPENIDIDLVEVEFDAVRFEILKELIQTANQKDYRTGWAWYKFIDKVKVPTKDEIKWYYQALGKEAGWKSGWMYMQMKQYNLINRA